MGAYFGDQIKAAEGMNNVPIRTRNATDGPGGPYAPPPPASVQPERTSKTSDVGTTKLTNEDGLRRSLKEQGRSQVEIDRLVNQYKASSGLR